MQNFFTLRRLFLFVPVLFLCQLYCLAQPGPAKVKKKEIRIADLDNFTVITCIQSEHLEFLRKKPTKADSADNEKIFVRESKLAEADFISLTASEKFIYAHQYPESYMQVCGLNDRPKDMTNISANIPYLFDGSRKSERQRKSLQENRDTTMACLSKCINFNSHIPLTYKQTILDINAWEFMPDILRLEDKMNKNNEEMAKDPSLYSLLMVLIKNNNFEAFQETSIYNNLYGPDKGYRASIKFTGEIRNQLIDLSGKFYLSKLSETK